jgi:hypothetical protein
VLSQGDFNSKFQISINLRFCQGDYIPHFKQAESINNMPNLAIKRTENGWVLPEKQNLNFSGRQKLYVTAVSSKLLNM